MQRDAGLIAEERLAFQVRVARPEDMEAVTQLRVAAYGRHLPALAQKLREPEAADFEPGNEVFVAAAKLDGSLLGTFRTHTNLGKPLPLEASMALPARFAGSRMMEATRLSVVGQEHASLVRDALFKAYFRYGLAQGMDWLMAAGRRPVDRMYDGLLFKDVAERGQFYPMAHAAGVLHRVMCIPPAEAEAIWLAAGHPLFRFAFRTVHPDIDLSGTRPLPLDLSGIDMSQGVAHAITAALGEAPTAPMAPLARGQSQCITPEIQRSLDSGSKARLAPV